MTVGDLLGSQFPTLGDGWSLKHMVFGVVQYILEMS